MNETEQLSVFRIYLRRRRTKPGPGLWGKLFGGFSSIDLVERALKAGVAYATVTMGHMGFLPTTLPTCIELVGQAQVREAFVSDNRTELSDAVILRLDGVGVSLRGVPT